MLKLSVLVPVFNEESTIIEILERINLQKIEGVEIETVVVDDGSKDNTISLLKANPNLYQKLVELPKNLGKGGAVIAGLAVTSGEYILFQDADLEYDPEDYSKLLMPVLEHKADVVIGSRLIAPPVTRVFNFWHKLGNILITLCFNVFNNTTFTDIYSCYILYKSDLVQPEELKENGFSIMAELLTFAVKRGKVYYEVPVSYHGRTYEQGKKIRPYHAIGVFRTIIFKSLFSR